MQFLLFDDVIIIVFSVVVTLHPLRVQGGELTSNTPDINSFSKLKQGIEFVILSGDHRLPKNYRFEDFFWTGSGDDSVETEVDINSSKSNGSPTEPSSIHFNQSSQPSATECVPFCDETENHNASNSENDVDHQFWLITVLESDGTNPILSDLKGSLEKLYKTAFNRHQKKHLGIPDNRSKRATPNEEIISVHIHNISKNINDGNERIEVIYHVSISGKPVIASTAAEDMKLVSDNEVVQALGYAPVIKAEPYLKPSQPEYLETARNTWLFIGAALSILFILLLLAALVTLSLSKKKKSGLGNLNRKQVFEKDTTEGTDKSFVVSEPDKRGVVVSEGRKLPVSYINYKDETTETKTYKSTGSMTSRPNSSTNSTTSSDSSLDISPLMAAQKKLKMQTNKVNISRPSGAINKTVPFEESGRASTSDSDTTSDFSARYSIDTVLAGRTESGILSAKSYLSMPSVKSFPRSNVPDSLNKILQPVSVLHLDLMDDNFEVKEEKSSNYFKHNSMSAMEDPGVIGPLVWELHRKRIEDNKEDLGTGMNPTAMRKRFHDLMDETFSLFGSRRGSSANVKNTPKEKSLSVASTNYNNQTQLNLGSDSTKPRPKTSYSRRSRASEATKPKGAWNSHTPSPLTRPVSAGILKKARTPQVDIDQVLAEGILKPNDPAVPLITSIKTELKKCSLPGSTTNLAE